MQSYKLKNSKFAVMAKPDLPQLVQSIMSANYKRGITCNFTGLHTSTYFDQETVIKEIP